MGPAQDRGAPGAVLRLRTLLTLPFVGLVLLPSLLIGGVALYTGVQAADHLSRQLVTDISQRVERIAVYQLQEASLLLSSAFPSLRRPDSKLIEAQSDIEALADRIFATLVASRSASYIYFARGDGAFVGVDRSNPPADAPAIQRVQRDPARPRTVYALDPTGQRLRRIEIETRLFRAPERPWFTAALDRGRLTWTPVYRSFASGQMVTTASLPVRDGQGHLLGIAAADIVLAELSDFMRGLRVSANGVAFIVDGAGRLVAQSVPGDASGVVQAQAGSSDQPMATDSAVPLIRQAAQWWLTQRPHKFFETGPLIAKVDAGGESIDVAARRIVDVPGLDWHVLVAIPRDDFFSPIVRQATVLFAIICVALVVTLLLGLWVLRRVTRDVGQLVDLATSTDATTRTLPPSRLSLAELVTLERAFRDVFGRWRDAWTESQARRAELAQLNASLETRVVERTQSLLATTEELQAEVARRSLYEEELLRSTEAARAAAEEKARFAAYLSHEIRTPLQTLVSSAEALRARALTATAEGTRGTLPGTPDAAGEPVGAMGSRVVPLTDLEDRLGTIEAACRSLISLADGVLMQARLEGASGGGDVPVVKAPVDVVALVTDARRVAVAAAPTQAVPVVLDVADDAPRTIASDGAILRQILVNLLSNALKFTSAGRITLRVSRVARGPMRCLAFAVEDTGVGIPEDAKERLFELFASSGSVRGAPGHGVGLFLSRQLVRVLGGNLEIESQAGTGTKARLVIPLGEVEVEPLPQPAPTARPSVARRVLVVDDHPVNREIIAVGLRGRGHAVDVAASGQAALHAAESAPYDVVLMDLNLPDMSGFDAARGIIETARQRGAEPPALLALTASTLDRDREAAREAGMQGFVSKPATSETIARAVEAVCPDEVSASPPAAASELAVLDERILDGLARAAQTDPSVIERLLRLAREELPKDVERWQQAVSTGQSDLAKNAAHRISGAAALLGAQRLADVSRAFMEGRLDAAEARLGEELDLLLDALARFEGQHRAI